MYIDNQTRVNKNTRANSSIDSHLISFALGVGDENQTVYFWLETNGNPIPLGWATKDGIEFDDTTFRKIDWEEMNVQREDLIELAEAVIERISEYNENSNEAFLVDTFNPFTREDVTIAVKAIEQAYPVKQTQDYYLYHANGIAENGMPCLLEWYIPIEQDDFCGEPPHDVTFF